MNEKHYEVVIVGGGISGAALFYELAKYSTATKICLLEKYEDLFDVALDKGEEAIKKFFINFASTQFCRFGR